MLSIKRQVVEKFLESINKIKKKSVTCYSVQRYLLVKNITWLLYFNYIENNFLWDYVKRILPVQRPGRKTNL